MFKHSVKKVNQFEFLMVVLERFGEKEQSLCSSRDGRTRDVAQLCYSRTLLELREAFCLAWA